MGNPDGSSQTFSVETLGGYAHRAIDKHFRKALKHEADVVENHDPEAIHQMRVGLRRLRTALQVFSPMLVLPKLVSVKQVRAIANSLGTVRDLDVLQANLKSDCHPLLPAPEQQYLEKVLNKLAKQRRQEIRQAQHVLTSRPYRRLKQACTDWLAQPTYTPVADLPIVLVVPDLVLPLISQLLLHPAWQVGVTWQENGDLILEPVADPEVLTSYLQQHGEIMHDLRKQVKRVRYQAELFSSFYGPDYADQLHQFANLQDLLGNLHDGFVLNDLLHGTLNRDLDHTLPSLKQVIYQQQIQQWQAWQTHQQRYLSADYRQSLRQLILAVRENGQLQSEGLDATAFLPPLLSDPVQPSPV